MNEITAEVYESRRLLKWCWRIRFVAANGAVLGHQYNDLADALHAVNVIDTAPMRLRIIYRDGRIEDRGLIG